MKRRFLMVSAMILLLGSQVQMYAQKKGEPAPKRPGIEMREVNRPGGPIHGKAISQGDIARLQEFYWKKYRVKLSKKEAEKILLVERNGRGQRGFVQNPPAPPKGHKPEPRGPQRPPIKY